MVVVVVSGLWMPGYDKDSSPVHVPPWKVMDGLQEAHGFPKIVIICIHIYVFIIYEENHIFHRLA